MIGALLMALQVAATDPAVVSRTVPDTNLGVTFRAIAFPDTVVVGQQARYQVAVFVTEARSTLALGLPAELIAVDTHGALAALGELTGQTTREEIIRGIFSRFCIGK